MARYTFSPVTSDDEEKTPAMVYAGEMNADNCQNEDNVAVVADQHLEFLTSETPCATEESTHIDIERIELSASTPRKKQGRKS